MSDDPLWVAPCILWIVPEGAIVGDARGTVTLIDRETLQALQAAPRSPILVLTTRAAEVHEQLPSGRRRIIPIQPQQAGPYQVQVGFGQTQHEDPDLWYDVWYLRGDPCRVIEPSLTDS